VWEWPDPKEAREWLTLVFAAAGPFVAWWLYKKQERKEELAAASNWSLHVKPVEGHDGLYLVRLNLDDPQGNKFKLVSLRADRPRGATLLRAEEGTGDGYGNSAFRPAPESKSRLLQVEREMVGDLSMSSTQRLNRSTYWFYIQMPSRPFWSRQDRVRAEIAAALEAISSSREESRIIMRTQTIKWAANSAQRTT
jgi:hypothetical protein